MKRVRDHARASALPLKDESAALFQRALVLVRYNPHFSNDRDNIVSSALLNENDLVSLGGSLRHIYQIEQDHGFDQLLAAIDKADRVCRSGVAIAGPASRETPKA